MNFKRVLACILTGTMVVTMGVPTVPTVADDDLEYNGYLCFQTPSYSFRNACDDESYGLNGGSNTGDIDYSVIHAWSGSDLVSAPGTFSDAAITGDGTYTASVSGLNWSDDEFGSNDCYNLIFLSTDIPVDALNYDLTITIDEFSVGGEAVELDENMILNNWEYVDPEDELTTGLQISIQNIYDDNKSIGAYDVTASEMSITFTVSGLDSYVAQTSNVASGTCGDNLTWSLSSDYVLTISGTGEMDDYSWGSSPWYSYAHNITAIEIEDGITHIGDFAFDNCDSVTKIEIPDSVTSIGNEGFYACRSITSIDIPDSVTSIGEGVFLSCESLESITIPNTITNIADSMFSGCHSLTGIDIPSSVTSIGEMAFNDCPSLKSIEIPVGVTSIGENVFMNCNGLTEINVSADNETYASADGILYNKEMTTLIKCPEAKEGQIDIPDGVISIENYAFYICTALTEIEMPESVTTTGYYTFFGCTGLISVKALNEKIEFGSGSFVGCTGLADENGYIVVNNVLYDYVGEATDIVIPDGVTKIDGIVYGLEKRCSIKSVVITEGVTEIGERLFYYYTSLKSIELPNSLTSIGRLAFANCGLEEIEISASVTSIGEYAFGYIWEMDSMGENIQPWTVVTIYGFEGSAAEKYVEEYGIYEYWDGTTEEVATFVSIGTIAVDDLGDINGDGSIDYLDAMTALRYDAELIELTDAQITAADVNGDGSVDSLDAILMLRYDAGLIESF